MTERWLPIEGYQGLYEISDFGRVKSLRRGKAIRARILKPVVQKKTGYLYITLVQNEVKENKRINLLLLETFSPPRLSGMQSRHLDGNRANNRLDNLAWGTAKKNQEDRIAHGTKLFGENNPISKLTWSDVERIRESFLFGATLSQLCGCYPVSKTILSKIVRNEAWKRV